MAYYPEFVEYRRLWGQAYIDAVLTEDGIYAKDNLPDSYGGAELEFKMPVQMIFGDETGSIFILHFYDWRQIKDSEDKEGVGLDEYEWITGRKEDVIEPPGPSEFKVPVVVEFNATDFEAAETDKLNFALTQFLDGVDEATEQEAPQP